MKRGPWFLHPISIFIFSILALVLSLFLYLYWYIGVIADLQDLALRFDLPPDYLLAPETWVVVLVLTILVGIILMGIFTIFVYNQKTLQLYRLQHNFINSFTHELKTPVTSLRLFLETFLKHELSREEQQRYIQFMIADITRLSDTIHRILDLARLGSKNVRINLKSHDLVAVIRECIDDHSLLFNDSRITIHPPRRQPLMADIDKDLFEMLVLNLLTNAVKYNASPTPSVDITFRTQRWQVVIQFTDNGIGLRNRDVKKIFRKFYQAGMLRGASSGGTGIGLHLVQNIARLHKGRVSAASEGQDQGTQITLTLPYRQRRRKMTTGGES